MKGKHRISEELKVLVLIPGGVSGRGGIEKTMEYLVPSACEHGWHLETHPTRLSKMPVVGQLTTIFSLLWFVLRLATRRYSVVHCNIAPRGSVFRKGLYVAIAKALRVKTLIHLHGSGFDSFYLARVSWVRVLIRKIFQLADRVVVLGRHWEAFAIKTMNLPPEAVVKINNGVPVATAQANPAHVIDSFTLVTVGLVGERKGTDVLLRALADLPETVNWTLNVLGNGEVEKFRSFARELNLRGRVNFLGWCDSRTVHEHLLAANLFVLVSRAENQPLAIIEAMALGLPIVSTTVGAIPEVVQHEVNGLLVPPDDAYALREALLICLSDPGKMSYFGKQSRLLQSSRFSIEENVKSFMFQYQALSEPR